MISRKSAFKSTPYDTLVFSWRAETVLVLGTGISVSTILFSVNYIFAVNVVSTDVCGIFGKTSHHVGPSNGFVDSSGGQIAHFDRKITLSGDPKGK